MPGPISQNYEGPDDDPTILPLWAFRDACMTAAARNLPDFSLENVLEAAREAAEEAGKTPRLPPAVEIPIDQLCRMAEFAEDAGRPGFGWFGGRVAGFEVRTVFGKTYVITNPALLRVSNLGEINFGA